MRFVRAAVALLLAGWLGGCGTTLRDVPALTANDVDFYGFSHLNGRPIHVEVIDERPLAMQENQGELEVALREVLLDLLHQHDAVPVTEGSVVSLTVRVRDVSSLSVDPFDPDRCVLVKARLEDSRGAFVASKGFGCHQVSNLFGMTLGGDIGEAYAQALAEALRWIDEHSSEQLFAREPTAETGGEELSRAGREGRLTVKVWPPGLTTEIDGRAYPDGNVKALPVAPGDHLVRVSGKGLSAQEHRVHVKPGEHRWVSASLAPGQPKLRITRRRGEYYWVGTLVALIAVGGTTAVLQQTVF